MGFSLLRPACPAETAAELFFKNVTKYFGVPKDIVSDRDGRFTGRFWMALFNMMGTELKFSTANHPQTDGQTERVNALVEDYLRHYVSASQRNWVDLLDVAQFSYNLHKSSATGMSSFELAYGQQPTTPHEIAVHRTGGKCPAAYRYARSKQELLDEAKDSLAKAQRRMKKYADMGRRYVEFSAGDQVLLKLIPQIWKKISSKSVHQGLIPKYDGSFEVMSKVGRYSVGGLWRDNPTQQREGQAGDGSIVRQVGSVAAVCARAGVLRQWRTAGTRAGLGSLRAALGSSDTQRRLVGQRSAAVHREQRSAAVRWTLGKLGAVVESTRQQGLGLGSWALALGQLRTVPEG
ncbi:UNVERIFIED_CONTAM: Transposon Ty3-I Gag-Pol polyprotein [Sesamum radiatum]|uniref:Transposon Ty3-I Gag-Pol polyprotein n=1 Tax=Sesamum radiatum TaxID=300843 RepID=A0AAW2S5S9_SESRA